MTRLSLAAISSKRFSDDKGLVLEWGLQTDEDGLIHVSLKTGAGGEKGVALFRHKERKTEDLVAGGVLNPGSSTVDLQEANFSGLIGSMTLNFVADDDQIELVALPRLLSWQLRQLRTIWAEKDRPAVDPTNKNIKLPPPIIDPDVIKWSADFVISSQTRAYTLWDARRKVVSDHLAALKTAREGAATELDGLDAAFKVLNDALNALYAKLAVTDPTATAPPGMTQVEVETLGQNYDKGVDISARLAEYKLELPAFRYLRKIRTLASRPEPVLESEWSDVYAILTRVLKNHLAGSWIEEEGQTEDPVTKDKVPDIILGPDFFKPQLPQITAGRRPPVVANRRGRR